VSFDERSFEIDFTAPCLALSAFELANAIDEVCDDETKDRIMNELKGDES